MVDDASVPIQVIITIVSFILSSLFASSEYALNILNESELKKFDSKRENKKYKKLYKVVENDTDYVEAMHLGRLLFLLLSAVCMFSVIAGRIVSLETVFKVLIIAAFIVLFTMLTAAFVYLIPHHVVLHDPVKRGMGLIGFICFFKVVFYPFVKLNYLIVKAILSVFRIKITRTPEIITEDTIISLVNEGQESGTIDDDEREMISNVFDLNDKTAGDVMTHRTEISAVDENCTYEELMKIALGERYSRIPVYKNSIDEIIGIIHIKDLLGIDPAKFAIKDIIREASFVPESQKLDDVLYILRTSSIHLAVVVDEYGGTAGIVTMEDILEELVGNIRDEYDSDEVLIEKQEISKVDDNTYLIEGLTEIGDVNRELGLEIPDDEYGTMSGFLISLIGEIPEENAHPSAEFDNLKLTVENSNDKIVTLIKLEILQKSDETDEDGSDTEKEPVQPAAGISE